MDGIIIHFIAQMDLIDIDTIYLVTHIGLKLEVLPLYDVVDEYLS